jgi:uncharacterized heparinase superfamily protein
MHVGRMLQMNPLGKKLQWYRYRLAAMSSVEIAHRFDEAMKRRQGRALGGWNRYAVPAAELPDWPIDETRFKALAADLEADWVRLWDVARAGRWHFLGLDWPATSAPKGPAHALWHLDPVTGHSWCADGYCFDISFRHTEKHGDVKYVWELNRLQFLPPLAALARQRKDEAVRDWCLACMDSWIDANPPFLGVNWASGIELATRAVSLMLTVALLGPETVPPALADKLKAAFNAHAYWLDRYPSLHSSANNHLISEAAGLYLLGTTMPGLPDAVRYRDYGFRTLIGEAHKQIHPDGVGAEQSPTYTAFTLEWYLLALAAALGHGETFPQTVMEQLHLAAIHLRWITDSAGNQPRIGDDDEGRVIISGPDLETDYVDGVMSGLSVATKDPAVAPPVARPHLRDLFVGSAPAHAAGPHGLHSFDLGGYTVFRQPMSGRETLLVLDHGPLGYLSIGAHGHADALSVWLHIDGQPVLIDAGTYLYHSGGEARDYFRGTRAHNTLTIDDEDQSRISGPFNWSWKAHAWRLPMDGTAEMPQAVARHDGYEKGYGVVHQRSITRTTPDTYLITDELVGSVRKPDAVARIRYVLGPDLQVTQPAENQVDIARDGVPLASIVSTFNQTGAPLALRLETTEVSPQFGVKASSLAIVAECLAADLTQHRVQTGILVLPAKGVTTP